MKITKAIKLQEQLKADRATAQAKEVLKQKDAKYKASLKQIEQLEEQIQTLSGINPKADYNGKPIKVSQGRSNSTSTAVLLVSDNHYEEKVTLEQTNGLNEHNLEIAISRNNKLWTSAVRLVEIQRSGTTIDNLVIGFLGDAITGSIHEEGLETNLLAPAEAIMFAVQRYKEGLDYILKNGKFKSITVICKIGNHSRMTDKRRFGTEVENSLEYLLYHQLAGLYASTKGIQFIIDKSYHTYLDIYDFTVRMHHGSALKYGGGVGGITIPVKKAISQWNKGRHADLDCFGHFHQNINSNDFVANASSIGYNSFALEIKAEFSLAAQTLFLISPKYGKTIYCPIYLQEPK